MIGAMGQLIGVVYVSVTSIGDTKTSGHWSEQMVQFYLGRQVGPVANNWLLTLLKN